jgi:hypothetical protein
MLESAGEPSETVIVARELPSLEMGDQDQAQCIYRSRHQSDRTPSARAGWGGQSRRSSRRDRDAPPTAHPPSEPAGEGGRVAREAQRVLVPPRSRCAACGTDIGRTAHPPPALAGEGGRVARACARPAVIATRWQRHTHGPHGARPLPAPAGAGGRVARAVQRVLVPPQSLRAADSTHMGRAASVLHESRADGTARAPPAAITTRRRRHTHMGRKARTLRHRRLGRAVASRGRHSACSSCRDRIAPPAAHTWAARRTPSVSAGEGGRVARTAQRVLVLPRSRRAAGSIYTGRMTHAFRRHWVQPVSRW